MADQIREPLHSAALGKVKISYEAGRIESLPWMIYGQGRWVLHSLMRHTGLIKEDLLWVPVGWWQETHSRVSHNTK